MKFSGVLFLVITSVILLTVAIFALVQFPFSWVFYLTVIGQILFIITVYRILKEDYSTDLTFDDFYEDNPIGKDE